MLTMRRWRRAPRSSATGSKISAASRAASTGAACTRSCAIGTKTTPRGTRSGGSSLPSGPLCRNGSSRTLKAVGPNATLIEGDPAAAVRALKARLPGEISVSGPQLAQSLTDAGLIDEARLYLHAVVLGRGKPFFAGPRPPLRLAAIDRIGEDVIRLTYVPA
jgi:hypothetical protein